LFLKRLIGTALSIVVCSAAATASVTVTSPTNNSTVPLSTTVVASATPYSSSYHVSAMQILVNGSKVYSTSSSSLSHAVSLINGSNKIMVKAWDTGGHYFEKVVYATGSSSASPTSSTGAGVSISSPANNSTVALSTIVAASATPSGSHAIDAMQVLVNGSKVYSTTSSTLSKTITVNSGSNKIMVKAWDTGGNYYEKVVYVTGSTSGGNTTTTADDSGSSSSTTSTSAPSTATTYSRIEEMGGWTSCTTCAGAGANGTVATYSMKQGMSSPSMDGNSAKFSLGGSTPYSDALWAKQLTNDATKVSTAKHFIYDMYFYYTNSHAVQGLEFNVSQYFSGKGFIYGVQCNVRSGSGPHWDYSGIKDPSAPLTLTNMTWHSTGVSCAAPPTYTWNHFTLEVERTSDNRVHYISLTLNGSKHYLNFYAPMRIAPSDWRGIDVHYQMNGNYEQEDYTTYVDKFSLTSW